MRQRARPAGPPSPRGTRPGRRRTWPDQHTRLRRAATPGADNDPIEQEKAMKFNSLLTNCVIFHNTLDIVDVVRQLQAEGWKVESEDLAEVSPYLTEHIMRFGEYSTHELAVTPEAYEPRLDIDFTRLHDVAQPVGRQAAHSPG
ncbi:transposase [Nonomuraea sp. NEAU-L178]|nr:transposase [Nonomuraea aurantiaca]